MGFHKSFIRPAISVKGFLAFLGLVDHGGSKGRRFRRKYSKSSSGRSSPKRTCTTMRNLGRAAKSKDFNAVKRKGWGNGKKRAKNRPKGSMWIENFPTFSWYFIIVNVGKYTSPIESYGVPFWVGWWVEWENRSKSCFFFKYSCLIHLKLLPIQ